jgi:AhpD family alkylhydroperoxidase
LLATPDGDRIQETKEKALLIQSMTTTEARIDSQTITKLGPKEYAAMYALEKAIKESDLDRKLVEMIKVRVSQINRCAFCLNMHTAEAREAGWTDRELHLLPAWRETTSFTPGERAVLDFAEHVTRIFEHHVPAPVFNALRESFTEEQILHLTWAVIAINSWNRLMITFTVPPAEKR